MALLVVLTAQLGAGGLVLRPAQLLHQKGLSSAVCPPSNFRLAFGRDAWSKPSKRSVTPFLTDSEPA